MTLRVRKRTKRGGIEQERVAFVLEEVVAEVGRVDRVELRHRHLRVPGKMTMRLPE